jgi:hypothetical protein
MSQIRVASVSSLARASLPLPWRPVPRIMPAWTWPTRSWRTRPCRPFVLDLRREARRPAQMGCGDRLRPSWRRSLRPDWAGRCCTSPPTSIKPTTPETTWRRHSAGRWMCCPLGRRCRAKARAPARSPPSERACVPRCGRARLAPSRVAQASRLCPLPPASYRRHLGRARLPPSHPKSRGFQAARRLHPSHGLQTVRCKEARARCPIAGPPPGQGRGLLTGTRLPPGQGRGLLTGTRLPPGQGRGLLTGTRLPPGQGRGLLTGARLPPGQGRGPLRAARSSSRRFRR